MGGASSTGLLGTDDPDVDPDLTGTGMGPGMGPGMELDLTGSGGGDEASLLHTGWRSCFGTGMGRSCFDTGMGRSASGMEV